MPIVFLFTMFLPVVILPFNIALYSVEKKNKALFAFLIAFSMAALAYNFRPLFSQNTDILRHWAHMENANIMSFEDAADSNTFSGLMGYFAILKLFSFAESKYLLQTVITLVGYFICLYVVSKMDYGFDNRVSFLTVFAFLSCISFLGFCSGIRQYLVFAIFIFTFYTEAVENKFRKSAWVVYVLLTTIHTSAVFFIILRIICAILSKIANIRFASFIVLFWGLTQNSVITFLADNFSGKAFIDKVVELSGFYEENPSKFIVPAYAWRFVFMIFCTVIVFSLIKNCDQNDLVTKKYLNFAMLTCMFTFGGFTSYDLFARFSTFSFMLIIPLIPLFFKKMDFRVKGITYLGLLAFVALVLMYSISQYLTFDFASLFEILTTNIITFIGAI